MPKILKTLTTPDFTFTGGTPASNEVLVSNSTGASSWELLTDNNISSTAEISPTKINQDELALSAYLSVQVFG